MQASQRMYRNRIVWFFSRLGVFIKRRANRLFVSVRRQLTIEGTKIAYKIPSGFSLSKLDYDRYLRTKSKEQDTFFWLTLNSAYERKWNTFVDIGCNVGVFSLLARHALKDVNIYAFDPLLENCLTTFRMLKENSTDQQCSIVQQAFLSDAVGMQGSIDMLASSGSTIRNIKEREASENTDDCSCLSLPLSSFGLYQRRNKDDRLSVCKIDVDGPELQVLKGFSDELFGQLGSVCVEVDILEPETALEIDALMRKKGLIPSKANIPNLQSYIDRAPDSIRSSIFKLKTALESSDSDTFEDEILQFLQEINYHDRKSAAFFSKLEKLSVSEQCVQRLAVNWFYYDGRLSLAPDRSSVIQGI